MDYQQAIQDVIQSVYSDIRVEAVIADLIENGLQADNFVVHLDGIFKRRYSHDISHVHILQLDRLQEILEFNLNRDGLYDALPEGLFHHKTSPEVSGSRTLSSDSKILKQEEKAARKFFLPFEHEIFYQRVLLELQERKILGAFNENIFNQLYPNLWDLHHSVKREYVNRMILMLHLSHKVVGNYERTATCLEGILKEPVKARIIKSDSNDLSMLEDSSNPENILGRCILGENTLCGKSIDQPIPCVEFTIGPLRHTQPDEYLQHAPLERFLKCFYGYFIPVEMDVRTTVEIDREEMNFTLPKEDEGLVLGYETAI